MIDRIRYQVQRLVSCPIFCLETGDKITAVLIIEGIRNFTGKEEQWTEQSLPGRKNTKELKKYHNFP